MNTNENNKVEELANKLNERVVAAINTEHKKMIAEVIHMERLPLARDLEVNRLRNQVIELQDMLEKSNEKYKNTHDALFAQNVQIERLCKLLNLTPVLTPLSVVVDKVKRLLEWNQAVIAEESKLNLQETGHLLGMVCGQDIRASLLPKVKDLIQQRDHWKAEAERWRKLVQEQPVESGGTFEDALRWMREGKKVKRKPWKDDEAIISIESELDPPHELTLTFVRASNFAHEVLVPPRAILATDWEVAP